MSAMPARVTELSEPPEAGAPTPVRALRRADRRATLRLARRSRQRWAIVGCAILGGAFFLTVGILDVLH